MDTTTFLDTPLPDRSNDELSCVSEASDPVDVRDADGRLVGQVAQIHIMGHGTAWMARDAHYAEWGDIPGQMMGWAGNFHTEDGATAALDAAIAQRRRRRER